MAGANDPDDKDARVTSQVWDDSLCLPSSLSTMAKVDFVLSRGGVGLRRGSFRS